MLRIATVFLTIFTLLCLGSLQAQNKPKINKTSKMITVTGDEVYPETYHPVLKVNKTTYPDVIQGDLTFDFVGFGLYSGYDLQSNGTTDEIWQDPSNPDNLHAVFMNSQQTTGWSDRTVTYFYSLDGGLSWFNVANVPTTGERSGFPSVNGFTNGTEIIALHTDVGGTGDTRTAIFIDQAGGSGTFDFCDPGVGPSTLGPPIWPRVLGLGTSDYVFGGSISTTSTQDVGAYVNTGNTSCTFSGYEFYSGDQAETYSFAVDDSTGTIGHLFLDDNGTTNVLYRQSEDGTLTWSDTDTLWKWNDVDSLGCIRGCDLAWFNGQPAAVFEIGFTNPDAGTYGPADPSYIYFWSPSVNGGVPMVIADSNSVPFYQNYNSAANDVMIPITRPTIGVSKGAKNNDALFVGFLANTDQYLAVPSGTDSIGCSYYAAWFTYSVDSGQTWTRPVKFTPEETPLRDWRYLSMSQNNVVTNDSICTVHMVVQADTIPGSDVNAETGYPVAVSAEMVGVTTTVTIPQRPPVGVKEDRNNVYSYKLDQNYPNPFNPTTRISYSVAERSNVSLKVYDMLGREVTSLVNTTKDAGTYEVNFDASNLASGLYIYKIQAGNFVQSKKMLLLK